MRRQIIVPTVALMGLTALGCGGGTQPTEPSTPAPEPETPRVATEVTGQMGPMVGTVSPSVTVTSDSIQQVRDGVAVGPASGDIEGDVVSRFNSDVDIGTASPSYLDGSAWGQFTITAADGVWEGSFIGTITAGALAGNMTLRGAGSLDGQELKVNFVETGPATGEFTYAGERLSAGG